MSPSLSHLLEQAVVVVPTDRLDLDALVRTGRRARHRSIAVRAGLVVVALGAVVAMVAGGDPTVLPSTAPHEVGTARAPAAAGQADLRPIPTRPRQQR